MKTHLATLLYALFIFVSDSRLDCKGRLSLFPYKTMSFLVVGVVVVVDVVVVVVDLDVDVDVGQMKSF